MVEPGQRARGARRAVRARDPAARRPLDRPKLAEIAFATDDGTADLNAITHPAVGEEFLAQMGGARRCGRRVRRAAARGVGPGSGGYEYVIVVEAPLDTRLDRLEERGVPRDDAAGRIAQQATDEERRGIATHVVDNGGDLRSSRPRSTPSGTDLVRVDAEAARRPTPKRDRHAHVGTIARGAAVGDGLESAPAGDQPAAIDALAAGSNGATGSRRSSASPARGSRSRSPGVIEQVQRPTIVLAPNKSLAAQLASEFRELFPKNRVEYFVSYYDYYQPEAYLPTTDTYIEKDSSINDEIDRLRHSATSALMSRRDVIVVASVSAIYGLGSPESTSASASSSTSARSATSARSSRRLVELAVRAQRLRVRPQQVPRCGATRSRSIPAYEERAVRIQLFGDEVERIASVDPLTGEVVEELDRLVLFPASHYVTDDERMQRGDRRASRTSSSSGWRGSRSTASCSRRSGCACAPPTTSRCCARSACARASRTTRATSTAAPAGEMPYTLLDYFPDDYLVRARRVARHRARSSTASTRATAPARTRSSSTASGCPSAMDNRPLRFDEFVREGRTRSSSCRPRRARTSSRCRRRSSSRSCGPTGLVDPEVIVRPTKGQIDDLVARDPRARRARPARARHHAHQEDVRGPHRLPARARACGSATCTARSTRSSGSRSCASLRLGEFDVLVGINLLREGLDLPEVSLVAILDADKEGFLRSETSLIQTIGRAGAQRRRPGGDVRRPGHRLDAQGDLARRNRRRKLQLEYNAEHGIDPQTIRKKVTDILEMVRARDGDDDRAARAAVGARGRAAAAGARRCSTSPACRPTSSAGSSRRSQEEMHEAAKDLRFEEAARLRDEITELKRELRAVAVNEAVSTIATWLVGSAWGRRARACRPGALTPAPVATGVPGRCRSCGTNQEPDGSRHPASHRHPLVRTARSCLRRHALGMARSRVQRTSGAATDREPSWSPTARQIVFRREEANDRAVAVV